MAASSMDRSDRTGLPAYVAALLRPEAYDHPADDLVLRDTHLSWVLLAGRFAYKLKTPVNLGFVDFSTAERRAAFIEPTQMSEMISISTGDSPRAAVARAMAFLGRINRTDT